MIAKTSFNILRDVDDTFRTIQAEVATGVLSGVETRKQIAQRMLNKFADSGVASFTDKLGRVWEMAAYAEMATRTVTARAALQGHVDRQSEAGRDLVVVSSHGGCPICRPWEGRILSISGVSKQYPSLADAQSAGLFHPNCSHSITGYIPGLTVLEDKPQRTPEQYEYTQRQRANERAIRQWKRRETVALTPEEAQKARAKIQAYQQRQREMLNEYENKFGMTLRRKYDRESITNRTGKRGINNSPAWASMKPRKIQAPKRPQTKKPPNVVKPVFNPNIYKNVSREQLEGYTSKFWGYS
jgi:hypothetical protein